ncbi:hypothetical protein CDD83_3718 [Cordyceps sp. RAO-2017]|nr:hypothetical protein CDD83_3718 [Cordyceps sp. RAO-2017]
MRRCHAEIYAQLVKQCNQALIVESLACASSFAVGFPDVSPEELAVDVATVKLALQMATKVPGSVHVMTNPQQAFSQKKLVQHGRRYHNLAGRLDPGFDRSRLVMKVAATWEGLQACRQLRDEGIKTLATTVFTIEQAILAGEVGCVSVSPFINELKALFDDTYEGSVPNPGLCAEAQRYYERHALPTRVKACANRTLAEVEQLVGIAAFTIAPDDLEALARTGCSAEEEEPGSFDMGHAGASGAGTYAAVYLDDEYKYRIDFSARDGGAGQHKLGQALSIFCDFQHKLEHMMRQHR